MNTELTSSTVAVIVREIAPLFPRAIRQAIELALPALAMQAARLGLEVLDAEQRGLKYSEAVQRIEFIKMQRVYYAASNLLQQPLPAPVYKALRAIIRHAAAGDFDPSRKLIFAIATRSDPEAALCRFLLWIAVRINLLVFTWGKPELETMGVLTEMEDKAEEMLRKLLDVSRLERADFRPLHVLVAGMLHETRLSADRAFVKAVSECGSELDQLMEQATLVERVRALDARSAATLPPLQGIEEVGAQQIVDRFPQHFDTVAAMEQTRSRLRRQVAGSKAMKKRFIDLLRVVGGQR